METPLPELPCPDYPCHPRYKNCIGRITALYGCPRGYFPCQHDSFNCFTCRLNSMTSHVQFEAERAQRRCLQSERNKYDKTLCGPCCPSCLTNANVGPITGLGEWYCHGCGCYFFR